MILVVDDNQAMLRSVARCLRGAGYEVVVAANADRARALAELHRDELDMLLTDVVMKDCSGPDLARSLEGSHPSLPVVFMTGHVGASGRSELKQMAGARVIMKPFDQSRLLTVVEAFAARSTDARVRPADHTDTVQ